MFVTLLSAPPVLAQQAGNSSPTQNRVALVIGNSNYQAVTVLPNPANDAKAVAEFLTGAGFEVIKADDVTRDGMRKAVLDFAAKATKMGADTVALIYYAGHGVQIDGENFLVPVDAKIERESDVPIQALRLADVMNMLADVPAKMRMVILDACRNNPFTTIKQTTGRGLAIVDAPTGSIVSYATAPGMTALDGSGDHSPFTSAFVETAKEPGLLIEQALKKVRLAVHKATAGKQTPWESSSLTVNFSFFPGDAVAGNPTGDAAATDKNAGNAPANDTSADNSNQPAGRDTADNRNTSTSNGAGDNSSQPAGNDSARNDNAPAGNDSAGNGNLSANNDAAGNGNAPGNTSGGGRGGPNGDAARPQNVSFTSDKRTIDEWRKLIRSRPPSDAFDLVIEEDNLEAYEAFVEIYPVAPFAPQVRSLLGRRQEMVAWYQAFVLNNASGYEAFIARFPNSDLVATARKLLQRARQRSVADNAAAGFAAANLGGAACSCTQPNQGQQPVRPQPIRTTPPNATPLPQPPDTAFENPPGSPPDGGGVPPVVIPPVWGGAPPVWIVPPRNHGGYPPYDGHRPPNGGRYPPDVRYPPNDGHRPPNGGKYPPGDVRHPPGDVRYPPNDGRRPPNGGKYPSGGDRHPSDVGRRPPDGGKRPPRDASYPPNSGNRKPDLDRSPPRNDVRPPRGGRRPPEFNRRPPRQSN